MSFGHRRNHGATPQEPAAPARAAAPPPSGGSVPPPPGPAAGAPAAPEARPAPAARPAPGAGGDHGSRLVRPYTLTGGRTRNESADFPIETLVVTSAEGQRLHGTLAHERRRIAELCREPISIAEVAARIGVPIGVARVLVGDLAADGLVDVHRPNGGDRTDLKLLERVLGGIRAL